MADCSKAVSLRLRVFPEQPDMTRPANVQTGMHLSSAKGSVRRATAIH
jgi:hypothetical protein